MAITRAATEQELVDRLGGLLVAATLAVTFAGANSDLNSSIGWAIRKVGGTVASISLVTDADVATVSDALLDDYLDLAELRTREVIDGNFADVDTRAGDVSVSNDQLRRGNERAMARIIDRLGAAYGLGSVHELQSGTIGLGFHSYLEEV